MHGEAKSCISNAPAGFARFRARIRALYYGLTRYRTKPPKGIGRTALSEQRLRQLFGKTSFRVVTAETFKDPRRSSSIQVQYVKAVKV